MRKLFFLIVPIVVITSCGRDDEKLSITNFNESRTIKLEPYKWYPYAMINIRVKGYVDDTIKIKRGAPFYDINLVGQLDTVRQMEYYGEGPVEFTFDPYRATKGNLEINIEL